MVSPTSRSIWLFSVSSGDRSPLRTKLRPISAIAGPEQQKGTHWSDWGGHWNKSENRKHRDLGLAEFCQQYETVELWFDMRPEAQLKLVWLLDYFGSYPKAVARLNCAIIDQEMMGWSKCVEQWRPFLVDIDREEISRRRGQPGKPIGRRRLKPASNAYQDLSGLLLLKPVIHDLLEELPSVSTGLGASEMRMLEMIEGGYAMLLRSFIQIMFVGRAFSAIGAGLFA